MSIIEFIFKDLIVNIVGKTTSLSTQLSDVFISRIDHIIQGACEDDIKDQIAFKSSSLDNCVVKRCRVACSKALLQWDWGERGTSYQALICRPRAIFNGRACSQACCRASNSLYCTRNLGPELSPSV